LSNPQQLSPLDQQLQNIKGDNSTLIANVTQSLTEKHLITHSQYVQLISHLNAQSQGFKAQLDITKGTLQKYEQAYPELKIKLDAQKQAEKEKQQKKHPKVVPTKPTAAPPKK